ncbi:MAG: response regulator [Nitratireductor sp.]
MTYRFLRAKGAGTNSISVRVSPAATLFTLCSSSLLQLAEGATINLWFYMASLGTAAIGGLIFFAMGKMLIRPLHRLEDVVQAVAEGHESNLIMMDISMPVLNGHEATMQIRAEEVGTASHVPILAVTAHAMQDDYDKALKSGMDDFITKPTSPKKLLAKIDEWLTKLDKRNVARLAAAQVATSTLPNASPLSTR